MGQVAAAIGAPSHEAVLDADVSQLKETLQRRSDELAHAAGLREHERRNAAISGHRVAGASASVDQTLRKVQAEVAASRRLHDDVARDTRHASDTLDALSARRDMLVASERTQLQQRDAIRQRCLETKTRIGECRASEEIAKQTQESLVTEVRHANSAVAKTTHGVAAAREASDELQRAHEGKVKAFGEETHEQLARVNAAAAAVTAALPARVKAPKEDAAAEMARLDKGLAQATQDLRDRRSKLAELRRAVETANDAAGKAQQQARDLSARLANAKKEAGSASDAKDHVGALRQESEKLRADTDGVEGELLRLVAAKARAETAERNAVIRLKALEGYQRAATHDGRVAPLKALMRHEEVARLELYQDFAQTQAELVRRFLGPDRAAAKARGLEKQSKCETCTELLAAQELDVAREKAAVVALRQEKKAFEEVDASVQRAAQAHALELEQLRDLSKLALLRVEALREEKAEALLDGKQALQAEIGVRDALLAEFLRQVAAETADAARRLPGPHTAPPGLTRDPDTEANAAAQVADLYLAWSDAVASVKSAASGEKAAQHSLRNAEELLTNAAQEIGGARQAVAVLETQAQTLDEQLHDVERAAEVRQAEQLRERKALEEALIRVHKHASLDSQNAGRELSAAEVAHSGQHRQLATLRSEANALAAELETIGQPALGLQQSVADQRRRNDLLAAELHALSSSHVLARTATMVQEAAAAGFADQHRAARPASASFPPSAVPRGRTTPPAAMATGGPSPPHRYVPPSTGVLSHRSPYEAPSHVPEPDAHDAAARTPHDAAASSSSPVEYAAPTAAERDAVRQSVRSLMAAKMLPAGGGSGQRRSSVASASDGGVPWPSAEAAGHPPAL